MTFTAIVSHTFFLLKEHEEMQSEQYEIKAEAIIHGTIFKELKVQNSHIIIVKLERAIEGFRFAKIEAAKFIIE